MVCSIFTKRYKVAKQNICLKLINYQLMKAHHPTHLGVKFDRQFTFNKYTQGSKKSSEATTTSEKTLRAPLGIDQRHSN